MDDTIARIIGAGLAEHLTALTSQEGELRGGEAQFVTALIAAADDYAKTGYRAHRPGKAERGGVAWRKARKVAEKKLDAEFDRKEREEAEWLADYQARRGTDD